MPAAARPFLLLVLLQTVSAGGGISLQALYDDRRWFELREAIRGKNVHPLYRGAVASAFHDVRQAEQYLKAAVRGASDPGEAEEAHLVLASLLADELAVLSVLNEERDKREAVLANQQTQPGLR